MKLGCGMYGLAFELEKDFWGTMQKLADAGFTAIEPLYAFPNDPALAPDSPDPAFLKTILWDDKKVAEYQPRLREMGLEKIFYPRNPVKRRITTSTPLGYLIGYLTQKESLITYAYSVIGA